MRIAADASTRPDATCASVSPERVQADRRHPWLVRRWQVLAVAIAFCCAAVALTAFLVRPAGAHREAGTRPGPARAVPADVAPFDYSAAVAVIVRRHFTVLNGPRKSGSPGPLRAFAAICTGGEGTCSAAFIFYKSELVDAIPGLHVGINSQDGQTVAVRFPQ